MIVLYVSDADCFALRVKHCLFGIQIGKNKIKPYLQALGGPSLPFSAFCQWDEKQSQWMYHYIVQWKKPYRKNKTKGPFVFMSCFFFYKEKHCATVLSSEEEEETHSFRDSLTYFCTVPLFKLLWKKLFHLGMFAQCVILLWTKSIKTWIIYHQNMTQ